MNKLLKSYGLNSDMQYFEMIAESFLNGQFTQAVDQFRAMTKPYKVAMLKAATVGNWQHSMTKNQLRVLFDNI